MSVNLRSIAQRLRYRQRTGFSWQVLPHWALFYIQIGGYLAQVERNKQVTLAFALPTRAYAAAFLGSGSVLISRLLALVAVDEDEHLKRLLHLPLNSVVSVTRGNKVYKGFLIKLPTDSFKSFIIQYETGTRVHLPLSQASRIQPLINEEFNLEESQRGKKITTSEFLDSLLGKQKTPSTQSISSTVIIGNASLLKHEVLKTSLGCYNNREETIAAGIIQDLLQVRSFSHKTLSTYSSHVLSTRSSMVRKWAKKIAPPVVIFDGSLPYLKWRDEWSSSHHVVILDRTKAHFEEAVELLNESYSYREREFELPLSPPPSIEVMAYEENR